MGSNNVDFRSGGYYVAGTRVSLDSIAYGFRGGDSPETIQQNFNTLTLEQVYGAIAFYLQNQDEVDRNISEAEATIRRLVPPLSQRNPELWDRLKSARMPAEHVV